MTLPKPKPKQEEKTDEQVQVISNEQLMHLKLDNIQMKVDKIISICEEPSKE